MTGSTVSTTKDPTQILYLSPTSEVHPQSFTVNHKLVPWICQKHFTECGMQNFFPIFDVTVSPPNYVPGFPVFLTAISNSTHSFRRRQSTVLFTPAFSSQTLYQTIIGKQSVNGLRKMSWYGERKSSYSLQHLRLIHCLPENLKISIPWS